MPELGINAAIAGYFKVPVIMLTGDTLTCEQAREILVQELVTVPAKDAASGLAARNLAGEKMNFHNSNQTELVALILGVKRVKPENPVLRQPGLS